MKELLYRNSHASLNYIEGPNNGPPLLLIHGNMGRWQSFTPILDDLMKDKHVFAVDLRGHGKSTRVTNSYVLKNHMLDMISFIKNNIDEPLTIIGLSLGGMIGLMLAANLPDQIKNLIMLDSPLTLDTLRPIIESQKEMGHTIRQFLENNQIKGLYEFLNDDFSAESMSLCDPDILTTTFDKYEEMIAGYDIKELFPRIKCPLLIIRGEPHLGSMISDEDMSLVRKLLPGLAENQISGVGHAVLVEPKTVLSTIKKFSCHQNDV